VSDNPHVGSSLDDFLIEEGRLEEATDTAIKRVLIWQLQEALEAQGLSKAALASRMGTSRTQIDRLLDPDNTRVTLHSLQRAASCVGRRLKLELV
jgi:predicted XRE-type DNA-binding protein